MPARKGGLGKTGARSASTQKGADAGKGRGGAKQINKVSRQSAASGKGSTRRGAPRGR